MATLDFWGENSWVSVSHWAVEIGIGTTVDSQSGKVAKMVWTLPASHLVCQTPTNHIQKTFNSRSPLLPWSTHCSLALSLVIIFLYTMQAQWIHVNMASGFIQYLHTFCCRFIKIQEDGSQGQHVQAWASLFYRFAFNVIILKDGFQYPAINFQKTISLENKN